MASNETAVAAISKDVAALRASFGADRTRPLKFRKRQLQFLRQMLVDHEATLSNSLQTDMRKDPHDVYLFEIGPILYEIQLHMDYLDDWAASRSVAVNAPCLPGQSWVVPEPLGVVLIFGTWNYPLNVTLLPLVGAISAGNCVFIRLPAEGSTDATNALLARLLAVYMDPDVVRFASGGLDVSKETLAQRYDLIFCTGSERIGKIIARAAAETLTPVVLELGGKSPTIVDATVNLELAAKRIAWGAFSNAGQTCVRPDHVFVESSIGDAFVAALKVETAALYGANAKDSREYARLGNALHFDKIKRIVDQDAAFVVHGGSTDATDRYIAPTIVNFKSNTAAFDASAAMADEIFGPVLPVVYYDSLSTVVARIKRSPKPLALYLFTTNKSVMDSVVQRTSSGGVCINDTMLQIGNFNLPFGGVGASGMGRYHGKYSFDTFSHEKAVMRKSFWLDLPQRYPPFTSSAVKFVRLVMTPVPRSLLRLSWWVAVVLVLLWTAQQPKAQRALAALMS
ncbi:hypothetical protein H310_13140 [Aphanomyces invadans]|uniref:Aldehyde dehydrogenase n=1 Tax=Aphanomyces invadans TaxID=157072 RepID=A0A024TGJ4_9STRA|nr:hypothetical protein H310_13140 [Aphanomyces invadans]ETV92711.1 hypothetical protein H310_13140 [Aphanomyces invadans]|eukprot:XP_008878747.1 hypothetical protein H310_13140 [Aphanomyces invadans]